ncbi:MAG: hypothetical protein IJO90_05990 [Alistipes sp.]|nr:hypothetical protein [Alistipes sp.]MBQ9962903.1 hypothetical protein [Alistipes sp.]
MPIKEQNKAFTAEVLAEVAKYKGTTEYAVIRELCALYDQFCDCPSTIEQRIYIRKRIDHHKLTLFINEQSEN